MKKTVKGILVIALISTVAVVATQAYFSSNGTVEGNEIATGSVNLTLNGEEDHESLSLDNFKPGETRTISYTLKNEGTISAQPSFTFGTVANNDNGCTEPESLVDNSCGPIGHGELGANLEVKAKWKQSGAFQLIKLRNRSGDALVNNLSGVTAGLGQMNIGGADHALPILNAGDEVDLVFTFELPSAKGNRIQSDSSIVDLTFSLDQLR